MTTPNVDVIVYHGRCPDGVAAAALASTLHTEAQLAPMHAGGTLPECIDDATNVLFVDCAPSVDDYRALVENGKYVSVLDHHASAADAYRAAGITDPTIVFDMSESGASLALQLLPVTEQAKYAEVVSRLRDRDLFLNQIVGSAGVSAAFALLNPEPTPETLDSLQSLSALEAAGEVLALQTERLNNTAINAARIVVLKDGTRAYATHVTADVSAIGHELAVRALAEFGPQSAAVVFIRLPAGRTKLCFRSVEGQRTALDCAQMYGGGGHPQAAGANVADCEAPAEAPF